jgi:hypothetical protein
LALSIALTGIVYGASAQIVVKIHPPRPHYVRVVAPSPRHVWIDEDWTARGGRYEWNGGRWVEPPQPGMIWIGGSWRHSPRGDVWVAGKWGRGHRR